MRNAKSETRKKKVPQKKEKLIFGKGSKENSIGITLNESDTPRRESYFFGILLSVPLIALIYFICIHIFELAIPAIFRAIIIICFIFPAIVLLSFFLLKRSNINERTYNQESLYQRRSNKFTIFISLFIFYATFFIGLLIFKEKTPEGKIPFLKDGSIGMRSWQSKVVVQKIKIHYHDLNGKWQLIPDEIVYDSNNWTRVSWHHQKLLDQINRLDKRGGFIKKWLYPKKITIKDSVNNFINDTSFILQNCALVFTPKKNFQQVFHDIRFDCEVIFEKINEPISELYPGFQLISFVDTCKVLNEKGIKDFPELCLQFNLDMNGVHGPWIPGLDYQPPTTFVASTNKMNVFGEFDDIKLNKVYSISSIILKDKVLFLGHTNGTVKLFEAELSKDD